mgnify:CR=1 FL=1
MRKEMDVKSIFRRTKTYVYGKFFHKRVAVPQVFAGREI